MGLDMEQLTLPKQRVVMVLEFDGALFHGWQRQDNAFSVQQAIEDAIFCIEGSTSCPNLATAGRTDAGVHATHMLIHADVDAERWIRSPHAYLHGMNFHLSQGVMVHGVKAVTSDFQARFDCFERRYQYHIINKAFKPVIRANQAWWVAKSLDVAAMNLAANTLLGEHDFSSFRASGCQSKSSNRNLKKLHITRLGDDVIIDVAADAFLYHMVRNLVGSLVAVGKGRWLPEYLYELLLKKDRNLAAETAPAHGLYFTDALYAEFSAQSISGKTG